MCLIPSQGPVLMRAHLAVACLRGSGEDPLQLFLMRWTGPGVSALSPGQPHRSPLASSISFKAVREPESSAQIPPAQWQMGGSGAPLGSSDSSRLPSLSPGVSP